MTKHRNHSDPVMLLRSVVLLVFYATCCCYAYDCSVGCDLDVSVNGDIVCGSDNNVYPNECFALCQVRKPPSTCLSVYLKCVCVYCVVAFFLRRKQ